MVNDKFLNFTCYWNEEKKAQLVDVSAIETIRSLKFFPPGSPLCVIFLFICFFQRQACLPLKFLHLVSVISIQELNWTEKELNMPVTISVHSVSRTYGYFSRVYSHNMLLKPSVFVMSSHLVTVGLNGEEL